MTLTNVVAQWRLSATAATTANQGDGTLILGDSAIQRQAWTDADIAYGLRITDTSGTDIGTLTTTSGVVALTSGTPSVTRWGTQTSDTAGEDFEGVAIPTLVRLYALSVSTPTGNTGTVDMTASSTELPDLRFNSDDDLVWVPKRSSTASGITSPGTLAFTFASSGDYVDVFIIGRSS